MTPTPHIAIALPCFSRGIGVEQDRLAQGHERRAEHALQQAVEHDLIEREGGTAQQARPRVKPITDQTNSRLRSKRAAMKPRRRRHDAGRHDIGGQHPGDLILRRRQRALHMRQGDIGDGRIQRLHDGRQHHRNGDQHRRRFGGEGHGVIGLLAPLTRPSRGGRIERSRAPPPPLRERVGVRGCAIVTRPTPRPPRRRRSG